MHRFSGSYRAAADAITYRNNRECLVDEDLGTRLALDVLGRIIILHKGTHSFREQFNLIFPGYMKIFNPSGKQAQVGRTFNY
jgi:hypothetical protein